MTKMKMTEVADMIFDAYKVLNHFTIVALFPTAIPPNKYSVIYSQWHPLHKILLLRWHLL